MKTLKSAGIVIFSLLLIVMVLALIAPKDYEVKRSLQVGAQSAAIFDHIRFFEKRQAWYPWSSYDPNMKSWVEGTDGQIGCTHHWEGNEKIGKGQQQLLSLLENERIESKINFIEPYPMEADSYIVLEEGRDSTKVTWGFKTTMSIPSNIMGLFLDLDGSVGPDYEKGLQQLKVLVETEQLAKD